MCLTKGIPIQSFWKKTYEAETVLPPMNFGRFGMAKNRFKEIKRKSRFGPPPTDDDRWAFIDPMEDAFNARMVLKARSGALARPKPWLAWVGAVRCFHHHLESAAGWLVCGRKSPLMPGGISRLGLCCGRTLARLR